jgi:hypothetical protein
MNFVYLVLFIFSILSLVSSIIAFRLMPGVSKTNWKKATLITTMGISSLMILYSGWGAFVSSGGAAKPGPVPLNPLQSAALQELQSGGGVDK